MDTACTNKNIGMGLDFNFNILLYLFLDVPDIVINGEIFLFQCGDASREDSIPYVRHYRKNTT